MLKWIITALVIVIILGLYFYTDMTKAVIDTIINFFK